MNDDVMIDLSTWIQQETSDLKELHISGCAITEKGFLALIGALECKDCFPKVNPWTGYYSPLYVRLENNHISTEVIQQKVKQRVVDRVKKEGGSWNAWQPLPITMVQFLVREWDDYQIYFSKIYNTIYICK